VHYGWIVVVAAFTVLFLAYGVQYAIVMNPSADTILRGGDRLRVFGLSGQIAGLLAAASDREA